MSDDERTGPPPPDGDEPDGRDREARGRQAVDPDRPCMNCGNPAPGEYCSSCGQRKLDVRVSVRTLIMDVLEDQFILDKRLPYTLGNLFLRPGRLTVEYVNGRIVRYIHPFRLYLTSSLLFFLVVSFLSLQLVRRALDEGDKPAATETSARAAEIDQTLARLQESLADTTLAGDARTTVLGRIDELAAERWTLRLDSLGQSVATSDSALAALDRALADSTLPAAVRGALETNRETVQHRRDVAASQQAGLAGEAAADTAVASQDEASQGAASRDGTTLRELFHWNERPPTVKTIGPPAFDSAVANQILRLGDKTPRDAAETLMGSFFDYAPIMMFVLLPVFAGVLKLLYIRRGRYYAEHFVFLLHVHSFVFLLLTLMFALRGLAGSWLEVVLGVWLVVYIYIAMMRVYGQGWFKTFLKYWTLGWMYFWILLFSMPFIFIAALLLF